MKELKIIKRNGKKVPFNPEKIALAIKKAFDSVDNDSYGFSDINKYFIISLLLMFSLFCLIIIT